MNDASKTLDELVEEHSEHFYHKNGGYHCIECDWWVLEGLEYLSIDHVEECEWSVSDEAKEEWDDRADEVLEGEDAEEVVEDYD